MGRCGTRKGAFSPGGQEQLRHGMPDVRRSAGQATGKDRPRTRPGWHLIFYLLAPALLWLALRSVKWPALLGALQRLELLEIGVLLILNVIIVVLLASRWWIILRGLGESVPLLQVTSYRLAGFAISYFTPGPQFGGEPLQANLLRRRNGLQPQRALGSVLVDKLIDLFANFGFLLLGSISLVAVPAVQPVSALLIAVPVLLMGVPLTYALIVGAGRAPLAFIFISLAEHAPDWLPAGELSDVVREAEDIAGNFWRAHRPALMLAVISSAVSWTLMLAEYYIMLRFLGIAASAWELLAMLTAARLAILLPFPGGLGALELGQLLAFDVLGFSPEVGVAVALMIRARDVLLACLGLAIGALYLRD